MRNSVCERESCYECFILEGFLFHFVVVRYENYVLFIYLQQFHSFRYKIVPPRNLENVGNLIKIINERETLWNFYESIRGINVLLN